ncbi:hypothetical protein HMPREF9141_2137 [Prevotella multiformis DSM 16608]|uniref:Uncharacterized protein n=1 Tax=Prevotella multiformis DSM 16608 TaxID=888743 RepID=F0F970_9BACT|nr:hypothetical protein HMPREF9141_2137 [Prevotella multiformis DSM 16608]
MDFLRIYTVFADDAAKLENKIVKAKAGMCFPWARTCYKQQRQAFQPALMGTSVLA